MAAAYFVKYAARRSERMAVEPVEWVPHLCGLCICLLLGPWAVWSVPFVTVLTQVSQQPRCTW